MAAMVGAAAPDVEDTTMSKSKDKGRREAKKKPQDKKKARDGKAGKP
jgi:hypothetical protein